MRTLTKGLPQDSSHGRLTSFKGEHELEVRRSTVLALVSREGIHAEGTRGLLDHQRDDETRPWATGTKATLVMMWDVTAYTWLTPHRPRARKDQERHAWPSLMDESDSFVVLRQSHLHQVPSSSISSPISYRDIGL